MNRRDFLKMTLTAGAGSSMIAQTAKAGYILGNDSLNCRLGPRRANQFPQLDRVGDNFSFVLVADPQLNATTTMGTVGGTSSVRYDEMIHEMNTMPRRPSFAILDGDLVGSPTDLASWDNFMDSTLSMNFLPILVYGNHDGNSSTGYYSRFQDKQQECNGTRDYLFSFNCGKWHFVAFPCDVPIGTQDEIDMINWLDQDLYENRNRPTMFFQHEHLMPQGLTQLEWYTYNRPFRVNILNTLAKYGNVKYSVCGHVHNGIKASVKTAWTWKGINFITAPTCTSSRPFGTDEEYPEFVEGLDPNGDGSGYFTGGGYYMLFDVHGEEVTVKGRLANVPDEYIYEKSFTQYTDNEPFWFKSIWGYTPTATLQNGSFENGLDGWMMPHKYVGENPETQMYTWQIDSSRSRDGGKSLYMRTRHGGLPWAQVEILPVYQLVQAPSSPLLKFSYFRDKAGSGGGCYVRIYACSNTEMKHMFLLDWGASDADKRENRNASRNGAYDIDLKGNGTRGPADWYIDLGNAQQAMFWTLPDTLNAWQDVTLNMQQVYDARKGSGAWANLGVTKLYITALCWTHDGVGYQNDCWFDAFSLTQAAGETSNVNGAALNTSSSVYNTLYGLNYH